MNFGRLPAALKLANNAPWREDLSFTVAGVPYDWQGAPAWVGLRRKGEVGAPDALISMGNGLVWAEPHILRIDSTAVIDLPQGTYDLEVMIDQIPILRGEAAVYDGVVPPP